MSEKRRRTAIVVGAGAGGIATAARLAKAGYKVTVVEKNSFTGGRCSLIHKDGYRFDQGPSLLLLPGMFHETFTDLGTSLAAEGVTLVKSEPNYQLFFHDGETLSLSTDTAAMKRTIETYEGKEGFERYLSFLSESHRHYEYSVEHVLRKTFPSFLSLLRPSVFRVLLALHPFESIWTRASLYFKTERLRRAFTFGSMYMGMSPFDAPGTYSLLQYTELAEGIWYPLGGFHAILDALVRVGTRLGVTYRLSTPVSSITTDPSTRRATGVTLSSGETLQADVTIINADLIYAHNALLPPSPRSLSLGSRPTSCSSLSFYWALDTTIPELKAHNIFLAEKYRESFDQIFKAHSLPADPSFYVNVPSRLDPSAAPAGKDALVVLLPCGHLPAEWSSSPHLPSSTTTDANDLKGIPADTLPALINTARSSILHTLESRLGTSIAPHIIHESINTPLTWREKFNLDRGAILGLSHDFFNVLSFRPQPKSAEWEGLWFVGASTHPGTGVPIVLAGGKMVAEEIIDTLGRGDSDSGQKRRGGVPWVRGGEVSRRAKRGKSGYAPRRMDTAAGLEGRDVVRAFMWMVWAALVVLAAVGAWFVWEIMVMAVFGDCAGVVGSLAGACEWGGAVKVAVFRMVLCR